MNYKPLFMPMQCCLRALFIICLYFLLPASSQSQRIELLPQEYYPPERGVETSTVYSDRLPKGTNSYWFVFSDRDNNPTYTSPGGGPMKTMSFMEPFVVVGETSTHLHLMKYDINKIDFGKGKMMSGAIDYGWAHKSNLLLWSNGLVNANNGFTIKALTVNTVKSLKNAGKYATENVIKLYNDPGLVSQNGNDVRIFQFLFVLKEEGNAVLIGKDEQINDPSFASKEILGWVSKDLISIWDQRLVLEPNYSQEAVQERKAKGVKVMAFEQKSQAEQYLNGASMSKSQAIWSNDKYSTTPMDAYKKRFPVLREYPGGLVRTGIVSDVLDADGNVVIKTDDYIKVEEEYARLREEFRHINIMFVIDGTTSMKPYFEPVVSAIEESKNTFISGNNDFRLGAVVYRDYPEANCEEGDRLVHIQSLTQSYDGVQTFLNGMIEECYDCRDKDKPEAVRYGLKKAVQQFSKYPEQTNIVVLIGDAGNREDDDVTTGEVVNMLAKYNCSVLAYQVANANDPAFDDFIFQANSYITQSSRKIATNASLQSKPRLTPTKPNIYRLEFPEESPVPGSLIHPSKGDMMPPAQLQKEISAMIDLLVENHENVLESLDAKLKSIGKGPRMNEAMYLFLRRMKLSDKELIEKASYGNIQLFVNAYTSLKYEGLTHPLYSYDILVNSDEVFELKKTLNELMGRGQSPSQIRQQLVNTYKEVLFQHYGKKEGKDKLATASIGDMITLVTGLPSRSTLLNDYRIVDLENPKKVDDNTMKVIINYVGRKLNRLEEEIEDNKQYKFRSNDVTYYWLPQDVLP